MADADGDSRPHDPGALRIRRVRPVDTDRIVALHRRALREAGTDPDDVPGTADLRWVEAAYLDTGGEFLVAERPADGTDADDEAVIVAMGGIVVDGDVAELSRFAVDPDHHRRGYGSVVLDALETAARDRGAARLELTTASRQAAAVSFYRTRGYAETGRERHGKYELVRFEKPLHR